MDPELKTTVLKNFKVERRTIVAHLRALSKGQIEDGALQWTKTNLVRIRNTLSMWSLALEETEVSFFACYPQKCEALAAIAEEIGDGLELVNGGITPINRKKLAMLAMQVGRLTVDGYTEVDSVSVKSAIQAEREQRKWDIRAPESETEPMQKLREIWTRMHIKVKECGCRQCLDWYLPSVDPPLSPQILPSPPPSPESESSGSSEN
ncbi:hypothetical protein N7462_004008 [Penicillium macrosclerotiorum]|uniref:uncharacterized protein n=1 Tax=Penicillium macrosclerotiorum TaxID=303699 RepID=UPI002548B90A|nr:uncharacterized protein N7462_004008 [Penicillium macrosclerotiorum]KAJ5689616.1 hypothetical protein N7462_004008 [Penicillium macrosclerotiorum]